jgi:peptide subunit release factor 1 (eRF1)
MLAVHADLKEVSAQACPECGAEALTKRSGLSWSKAVCTECDTEWYLKG